MKYLIQHKKETFITALVFATILIVVFWALWSIIHGQFSTENLFALIAAVVEFFGWYYNMPTSEENCEFTGLMRQKKAEKKDDYVGERFFDDPEEIEEGDEDDE